MAQSVAHRQPTLVTVPIVRLMVPYFIADGPGQHTDTHPPTVLFTAMASVLNRAKVSAKAGCLYCNFLATRYVTSYIYPNQSMW